MNSLGKVYIWIIVIILIVLFVPAALYPREYGVLAFFAGFAIIAVTLIAIIIALVMPSESKTIYFKKKKK